MRLEQLYENFGKASPEQQAAFMSAYRLRRAEDMSKPASYKKRKSAHVAKPELTDEEKLLAKLLGLRQKDILALRTSVEPEEAPDDAAELFKDSTYEEDDE